MVRQFWPDNIRLVISVSMQFETGAQPERNPFAPFHDMDPETPNLAAANWFEYGAKEGIPRLLDLWDKKGIKVTSHMVGQAVERYPDLAREIVQRGHEAAAHGQVWQPHWRMSPEVERASYEANISAIEEATGTCPSGFNAFALRHGPNTLKILASLGFRYFVDDVSRDEPFAVDVEGQTIIVVPYTRRNNDIERFHTQSLSIEGFIGDLKHEFWQLYDEAQTKRRMMSISVHDRIGGQPGIAHAVGEFIDFALARPGVVFMRKDQIAAWAAEQSDTPREVLLLS